MFAKRLLIVIASVAIFSLVAGNYFDQRYIKRWQWLVFDKMESAMSATTTYDILLLGNSRIHTGLNPYYIDSITGLSSYNFAIAAGDEQEMKLLSTVYLEHHTAPKIAVIGVDNAMLIKYNILKERFQYLFYLQNDTVNSFLKRNGFPTELIRRVPFLKYSFFDEYNRTSIFRSGPKIPNFEHNICKGFINAFPDLTGDSSSGQRNQTIAQSLPAEKKINDTATAAIRQTVELFRAKGSQVVFLYPPMRDGGILYKNKHQISESFFLEMAATYDIPVIRTDTSGVYGHMYFIDKVHLNEPGSRILSREVGEFIRDSIMKIKTKR